MEIIEINKLSENDQLIIKKDIAPSPIEFNAMIEDCKMEVYR